jgi:hypothetical protein
MLLGTNYVENDTPGYWNIYRQLCFAAKKAATPFVAMVEDDTLYPCEHFTEYRPEPHAVSYNRARWSLFSWEKNPIYCLRQRISNCSLIAPRELLIEAIDERLMKHPDGDSLPDQYVGEVGRHDVEKRLGVTLHIAEEWWSTVPVVQLNHANGIDNRQRKKWKKHGQLKAIDIPYWGKAKEISKHYV